MSSFSFLLSLVLLNSSNSLTVGCLCFWHQHICQRSCRIKTLTIKEKQCILWKHSPKFHVFYLITFYFPSQVCIGHSLSIGPPHKWIKTLIQVFLKFCCCFLAVQIVMLTVSINYQFIICQSISSVIYTTICKMYLD